MYKRQVVIFFWGEARSFGDPEDIMKKIGLLAGFRSLLLVGKRKREEGVWLSDILVNHSAPLLCFFQPSKCKALGAFQKVLKILGCGGKTSVKVFWLDSTFVCHLYYVFVIALCEHLSVYFLSHGMGKRQCVWLYYFDTMIYVRHIERMWSICVQRSELVNWSFMEINIINVVLALA